MAAKLLLEAPPTPFTSDGEDDMLVAGWYAGGMMVAKQRC